MKGIDGKRGIRPLCFSAYYFSRHVGDRISQPMKPETTAVRVLNTDVLKAW